MTKLKLSLLLFSVMSLAIFVACSSETETSTKDMAEGKSTLKTVQDRGTLKCGVNDNLTGFGVLTSGGTFEGFDIDYCKAVAAAILVAFVYVILEMGARAIKWFIRYYQNFSFFERAYSI